MNNRLPMHISFLNKNIFWHFKWSLRVLAVWVKPMGLYKTQLFMQPYYRKNAATIEMVGNAANIDIVGKCVNMSFVGKCEMISVIEMV